MKNSKTSVMCVVVWMGTVQYNRKLRMFWCCSLFVLFVHDLWRVHDVSNFRWKPVAKKKGKWQNELFFLTFVRRGRGAAGVPVLSGIIWRIEQSISIWNLFKQLINFLTSNYSTVLYVECFMYCNKLAFKKVYFDLLFLNFLKTLILLRGVRTGTCMCSFEEKEFTNLSSTKEFLAHPHSW